jgi:hypothetical protein
MSIAGVDAFEGCWLVRAAPTALGTPYSNQLRDRFDLTPSRN